MKKFLAVLLSIIFAFGLFFTLLFNTVRIHVSVSKIMDLSTDVLKAIVYVPEYDDGLFHPDQKVIRQASFDLSDYDIDLQNLDLTAIVQQIVDANGLDIKVDDELIDEILTNPEAQALVENIINQVMDYVAGEITTIEIDADKVEAVVTDSIKTVEKKTGKKIDYDPKELKEVITEGMAEVGPALAETLDEVKEDYSKDFETVKKVLDFFTMKNLLIFCGILIVIALLIFALRGNIFAMFKHVGIPAIVVGVIYLILGLPGGFITSVAVKFVPQEFAGIITPVSIILKEIFKTLLISGIATFASGLALTIVGSVCGAKKKI